MDNIVFKKSKLGGFDPEDVMDYIRKITDDFSKAKKQLKKENDSLRTELRKCRGELKAAAESVSMLEKANEEANAEKEALAAEIEKLNRQNEKNLDLRQMLFEVAGSLKNLVTEKPEEGSEGEEAPPVQPKAPVETPVSPVAEDNDNTDSDDEDINDLIRKYS